jgi:5-formyltetrahydrofolate cyclo-ligase
MSLRALMRQRRQSFTLRNKDNLKALQQSMIDYFLNHFQFSKGIIISGFWPIQSEIDPRLLMEKLHTQGHTIVLPVVKEKDKPLSFYQWVPKCPLVEGEFGVMKPMNDAQEFKPDILLVPQLAFDEVGHRLGYGRGYFDRTLHALRQHSQVMSIGLAYSIQELGVIPISDHDEPLDYVVTEKEVRNFPR